MTSPEKRHTFASKIKNQSKHSRERNYHILDKVNLKKKVATYIYLTSVRRNEVWLEIVPQCG